MSKSMDETVKRWTAKRKTALVIEIIQGKTTVAEASRTYDLTPSEIEGWVDDAKKGLEHEFTSAFLISGAGLWEHAGRNAPTLYTVSVKCAAGKPLISNDGDTYPV